MRWHSLNRVGVCYNDEKKTGRAMKNISNKTGKLVLFSFSSYYPTTTTTTDCLSFYYFFPFFRFYDPSKLSNVCLQTHIQTSFF